MKKWVDVSVAVVVAVVGLTATARRRIFLSPIHWAD